MTRELDVVQALVRRSAIKGLTGLCMLVSTLALTRNFYIFIIFPSGHRLNNDLDFIIACFQDLTAFALRKEC